MREQSPSMTAAWVAAARGLGAALPEGARLADDPFGRRFATPAIRVATSIGPVGPLFPFVLYMQLRTRAIDDVLRAFAADGGAQVVLLGAGFDCRAARFAEALGDAAVFEVDHPATQKKKRAVLAGAGARSARVVYVPWNFEARPLAELPAALAAAGHDASRRTLTVWEGVTMYLTEEAVSSTVAAVAALSAPGSPFAMTYFDRALIDRPRAVQRAISAVVRGAGEPFTFGFAPGALPAWLGARGFGVEWDKDAVDLAGELLPPSLRARARAFTEHRHIALARRA